jgi:putative intracellular protease/amidase
MAAILMIVTSAGVMPNGDRTGLWLEEFAVPYNTLREAGHAITVASPKGGSTPIDPRSDEAAKHPEWRDAAQRLQHTQALHGLKADDFDAVFIPGGHGTMFDFPDNATLGALLSDFHAQNKLIASVCHGPAAFVGAKRADGRPLVEGYTLTAFSDTEEKLVGLDDVVPFLLSKRLRELGADVVNSVPMLSHVKQDRLLITGQNPKSSARAAELLVNALEQGVAPRAPARAFGQPDLHGPTR